MIRTQDNDEMKANQERDAELTARLQRHDPAALDELFDRYGRLVYSLIVRVVRDSSMAEDLVQETFLRVWNRVHAFDAYKGSLASWLLAIARNCAIDYLRSSSGRHRNTVDFDETDHLAVHSRVEHEILNSEKSRQIKCAVERLCPNQRQAIELAFFAGLSHIEMAKRMGHPLGTVKTWVRKALLNLREELGPLACAEIA